MNAEIAALNLVQDFKPGGASALGPLIGKAAGTLSHEVDPNFRGAKLGLADAVKLTLITGDRRILEAFAAEAGCIVIKVHDPAADMEGGEAMAALGRVAKEAADYVALTCDSLADGRVTENELLRLEREAGELMGAVQGVLALARARHEAGKPAAAA